MTNIQDRAKRIQEILETQDILKDSEHEQVKKVGNDLLKTVKCWKDEGIDRVVADSSGFAFFLRLLTESHSIEDIKTVVEVAHNALQKSDSEELDHSQESYDQVAGDIYACLDKWHDAGICGSFALEASLDLLAQFTRDVLPACEANALILDAVSARSDSI